MKYVLHIKKLGYFRAWSDKYADIFMINSFESAKRFTKEEAEKLSAQLTEYGYDVNIEPDNSVTNEQRFCGLTREEKAKALNDLYREIKDYKDKHPDYKDDVTDLCTVWLAKIHR